MMDNQANNRAHWVAEEKKLDERVRQAMWPGGDKAVERLAASRGKRPVRQLIDQLVDGDTPFF